jgi:hypothetical protein
MLYNLAFKEVHIVKSALQYLVENLYQVDKVFVDWFELNSDFCSTFDKKMK